MSQPKIADLGAPIKKPRKPPRAASTYRAARRNADRLTWRDIPRPVHRYAGYTPRKRPTGPSEAARAAKRVARRKAGA